MARARCGGDAGDTVKRHRSASRVVRYGWSLPDGNGFNVPDVFNEHAMTTLLAKAITAGVITQFDTGRGAIVWFEGTPGARLRALKAEVLSRLPAGVVSIDDQRRLTVTS